MKVIISISELLLYIIQKLRHCRDKVREAEARQVLYDITSQRDKAYTLSSKTGNELINEIILQKRIELWGEGYAWFDMKRLNTPLERIYPELTILLEDSILAPDKFKFQIPNKRD